MASSYSAAVTIKINQNINEEERKSEIPGTGVSQKDLRINRKTENEKNAKISVEKGRAHGMNSKKHYLTKTTYVRLCKTNPIFFIL